MERPPIKDRISVNVRTAEDFSGISRTTLYSLIADGTLESRKVRGRRLVLVRSLLRLVEGDKAA